MTGAVRLAARAARRIGVGLLTIASPKDAFAIYAGDQPGAIVRPIASDADFERLAGDARVSALLVGPGAGVSDATRRRALLALATGRPCVLDADAISSLADAPEALFRRTGGRCLLTPHEGEFAKLFGEIEGSKAERALEAARRSKSVVVYKGPDTLVASPDGRLGFAPPAPATLASAGTGDVLAGMIAALRARGLDSFDAACAGVWLHGRAAEAAGPVMIADDLVEAIPQALS